jgi:hypothetical protein
MQIKELKCTVSISSVQVYELCGCSSVLFMLLLLLLTKTKLNSVALVRERTMPTERPPLVGEVVPTFADRGCCMVSATDSHGRKSRYSRLDPLLFLPSSSSVILTRLSRPHSRLAASQKIWKGRESNLGPPDL